MSVQRGTGEEKPKGSGASQRALRLIIVGHEPEDRQHPAPKPSLKLPPAQHLALLQRSIEVGEASALAGRLEAEVLR